MDQIVDYSLIKIMIVICRDCLVFSHMHGLQSSFRFIAQDKKPK